MNLIASFNFFEHPIVAGILKESISHVLNFANGLLEIYFETIYFRECLNLGTLQFKKKKESKSSCFKKETNI